MVGFITVCVEHTRLESDWDCFWVRRICLCGFGFSAFIGFWWHCYPLPTNALHTQQLWRNILATNFLKSIVYIGRASLLRDAWDKAFSVCCFFFLNHLYNSYGVNIPSVNSEIWHSKSPWEYHLMNVEYRLQILKVLGERCSSHTIFRRLWAVFLRTFYNSQVFLRVVETISSHFRTK